MASPKPSPPSIAQHFIGEVRREMKKQNLSQAALAARLGRSSSYVSKVLRSKQNPTAATMDRFAEALRIEFSLTGPSHEEPDSQGTGEAGNGGEPSGRHGTGEPDLAQGLQVRNSEDARAFLDTCGPQARRAIFQLVQDATSGNKKRGKPGRKKGSGADCRPQMLYMAHLLVGDDPPSESEASRLAAEWAAEERANAKEDDDNLPELLAAETLRGRFRKNRESYLAQARRSLTRQRRETTPAPVRGTPASRAGRASSGSGGGRASTGYRGLLTDRFGEQPLAKLRSVNEELDRIAGRYDLSDESVAFLRTPGVLEEIGRLGINEIDDLVKATAPLPAEVTAPWTKLARQVNEPGETMRALMSELQVATLHDRLEELTADMRMDRVEAALRSPTREIDELIGLAARPLDLFK